MAINHAMWVHGHTMNVEYPNQLKEVWRAGYFIRLTGKPNTFNWFHFYIPTPVIVGDKRLNIHSAMVRFKTLGSKAVITNVHIYDGEKKIANHNNLNLVNSNYQYTRFNVPGKPKVLWGVGVSVCVKFNGTKDAENIIDFSSAGVDFI